MTSPHASKLAPFKSKTDPIQASLQKAFFACHPTIALSREFLLQIVPQNCCTYLLDFVVGMLLTFYMYLLFVYLFTNVLYFKE